LLTFSNSDILSEDIIYGALANINYSSELILGIFEAFLSFKMSRINPLPDGTTRLENNQVVPFCGTNKNSAKREVAHTPSPLDLTS
jgi:hypothetical protein